MGKNEQRHVAQNVRVPLGLLLKVTIVYMTEYGHGVDSNLLPFVNNLLHAFTNLHHFSKPILSRFKSHERPWLPKPEIQSEKFFISGTSIVHDTNRITEERRAFSQYSTDLSTPLLDDPPEPFLGDKLKQAEQNWEGHQLPKERPSITWCRFCRVCGGKHRKCPLRDSNTARCFYPLCNRPEKSHTTKVCRSLHRWCDQCGMRGHMVEDHKKYCHETLQRVFIKWAPFGLYTSLVFLDPENKEYWTYFLFGVGVIDPKIVLVAGLEFDKMEEDVDIYEITDDEEVGVTDETKAAKISKQPTTEDVVKNIEKFLNSEEDDDDVLELMPTQEDRQGFEGDAEETDLVTTSKTKKVCPETSLPKLTTPKSGGENSNQWDQMLSSLVKKLEEPMRNIAQEAARTTVNEAIKKMKGDLKKKDPEH